MPKSEQIVGFLILLNIKHIELLTFFINPKTKSWQKRPYFKPFLPTCSFAFNVIFTYPTDTELCFIFLLLMNQTVPSEESNSCAADVFIGSDRFLSAEPILLIHPKKCLRPVLIWKLLLNMNSQSIY